MEQQYVTEELSREACIFLHGTLDQVFPLFEPLNEKRWVQGWNPEILYPPDGQAIEHMIFTTAPRFAGEERYRWILTHLDKEKHIIAYTVSSGQRIWFVRVSCEADGSMTNATVRYSFIGLTDEAHQRNRQALDMMFSDNLADWEEAINAYLSKAEKQLT